MDDHVNDGLQEFLVLQIVHFIRNLYETAVIIIQASLEFETNNYWLEMDRPPVPYQAQLDHLNRLVTSEVDCHEQLCVNRHTFMVLCNMVRSRGLRDSKFPGIDLRSGFFIEVEKKLVQKFLGIDLRASPYIESKVKVWKRHYHTLSDMLKTSGFGWDDETKMILVDSDDVWNNYVAKEPKAAHMRDKKWPYYDDWLVLFERDRAIGDLAEDAAEMVETKSFEQMSINLDDDLDGGFNNPTSMDASVGSNEKSTPAVSATATSKSGKKRVELMTWQQSASLTWLPLSVKFLTIPTLVSRRLQNLFAIKKRMLQTLKTYRRISTMNWCSFL